MIRIPNEYLSEMKEQNKIAYNNASDTFQSRN